MNILALDTSTRFLCIGIEFEGKTKGYRFDLQRRLSEKLIPLLDRIFRRLKVKLEEFDFFCVGIGPGSFTGLRVGIAIVKGLSLNQRKNIVCVPSLDIIANNISSMKSLICPIVDARRNLVYSCLYRKTQSLKRTSKYLLVSIDELSKRISGPAVFLGNGLLLYRDLLEKRLKGKVEYLSEDFWYPTPNSLIELAKEKIKEKKFCDPFEISPLYLYPKECQIRPKT